ncbi:tRNA (adenosine(37)-N6)-dimethylallyltransferase MiaA [Candidatus Saccharibacteria bacterium]|nr:MAG: tRNA (adenosine(37)-N6)-dimethylallyltransferase MiaA [Candidatus Saccharibacteria bacterium]
MATIDELLIVITGPTGSGKTGLAIELAEKYGGEIICADSRTVYTGMDIGTAKPTEEEQARVPHHLLDVVEPDERFTVHDFQTLARQAIVEIRTKGKIPFLVGGTGLYIDSVVLDYEFGYDDAEKRQALSEKSVEELQTMIKNQHLTMPYNAQNKRHLVQVLAMSTHAPTAKQSPSLATHVVAITTEKAILDQRIVHRARDMFAAGVLDEARQLGQRYGWESEAMTGNIYPILRGVLDGDISQEQAIGLVTIRDRRLVKRQITWLKRHSFVQWKTLGDARLYLEHILSQQNVLR